MRRARTPTSRAPTATAREGPLHRTISATVLFALVAVLATALLAWVAYRGARDAIEGEASRRIAAAAASTASQVSPADLADARRFGEDGAGYAALQVQLEGLRVAASLTNATVFDTARTTLYDCRDIEALHATTRLDSIAPAAVAAALAGRPALTRAYALDGVAQRAALAPVLDGDGRVAGVLAVEARLDHLARIAQLRRTLALAAGLVALAIGVLAALVVRAARTSARLETRLSRAENLAAMGRLTATLAHEIKNPLAIIRGSAQRLGKLEPEAKRMADYVVEESDRLTATVGRYLQFARGDAASADGGDALAALDATLALLEGELRARRVTLARAGSPPSAAPVPLDNESLKQVYLNLMLNALDAMTEGGTLTVACTARGRAIEIAIADTGAGMTPEQLRRLGEPFHTTKAQGSGLGLFLTRRLVDSAGGALELRSAPGRGTTATVRLPLERGRPARTETTERDAT